MLPMSPRLASAMTRQPAVPDRSDQFFVQRVARRAQSLEIGASAILTATASTAHASSNAGQELCGSRRAFISASLP